MGLCLQNVEMFNLTTVSGQIAQFLIPVFKAVF